MTAHQIDAPRPLSQGQFVRDRLIWVYYALVGLNCYIMSALGPVMPFLRSELSLNYQLAGMHFSSLAVGTVAAGLLGDRRPGPLGPSQRLCGLASLAPSSVRH